MELREPKKKHRVKPKDQMPFPIPINGSQEEWPTYTAHLTDIGACIIEPDQIRVVYKNVCVIKINVIRLNFFLKKKKIIANIKFYL